MGSTIKMLGKLFFAIMFKDKATLNKTIRDSEKNFGNIVDKSRVYDFNFTDYYKKEFGDNLKKTIIIFDKKIDKKSLVEIKIKSNNIEKNYSVKNKRKINIDPGYVNNKEVVLASFKKKDFKEDLGNGVFSHKVLEFNNGQIKDFFHTFPDFKNKLVQDFFLSLIK